MALYRALPRLSPSEIPSILTHLDPVSFMVTMGASVEKWWVYFEYNADTHTPVLLARECGWNVSVYWYPRAEHTATGAAFFRDLDAYCERVEFRIASTGRVSGSISRNKVAGNYSEWEVYKEFEIRV